MRGRRRNSWDFHDGRDGIMKGGGRWNHCYERDGIMGMVEERDVVLQDLMGGVWKVLEANRGCEVGWKHVLPVKKC